MSLILPQDNETGWGQKLRDALNTLLSIINTKANTNHQHTIYALKSEIIDSQVTVQLLTDVIEIKENISVIQNMLNLMFPSLDDIEITANFINGYGGLRIQLHTTPNILIANWNVKIRLHENGPVVYDENHGNSSILISHHEIVGWPSTPPGNPEEGVGTTSIPSIPQTPILLYLEITLRAGNATKTIHRTHNYIRSLTLSEIKIEEMGDIIKNQLTISNIAEAIAQDPNVIIAIKNQLQHSNILAAKVAELSNDTSNT